MRSIAICEIAGHGWQMLAEGGLYWPRQQTLLVADTHFGKAATFRHHHVPVPSGATKKTISKIEAMLSQTQARRLVILGDLLHARSSASEVVLEMLDSFFSRLADVDLWLTLGNHDRHVDRILNRWPITAQPEFSLGNVHLGHFPLEDAESPQFASSIPSGSQEESGQPGGIDLRICGHLHPAIRLSAATDQIPKLPCFWLRDNQLVLPAVGDFTGTHAIRVQRDDRVWVLADNEIIEVSGRVSTLSS